MLPIWSASVDSLGALLDTVSSQEVQAHLSIVCVLNNRARAGEIVRALEGTVGADISFWQPGVNLGFAGAIEWVRRETRSEYLWVLQEDVVPQNACLQRLLDSMSDTHSAPNGSTLAVVTPVEIPRDEGETPWPRSGGVNYQTGEEAPHGIVESHGGEVWGLDELAPWSPFVFLSGALVDTGALEAIGGVDSSLWPLQEVDSVTCRRLLLSGYGLRICKGALIEHQRNYGRYKDGWNLKLLAFQANRDYNLHMADTLPQQSDRDDPPAELLIQVIRGMERFIGTQSVMLRRYQHAPPRQELIRALRRVLAALWRRVRKLGQRNS